MDTLGTGGMAYAGITVGEGRSDEVNRVYAGGWYTPIHEYTWDGGQWDQLAVSSGNRNIWPMAVGPGRDDAVERLYCPDRYQSYVREYTWGGSDFEEVNIGSPSALVKVIVGPGRNDGINRVYGAGLYGHIQELTYDAGDWNILDIHPDAPNLSRYGLCLARAQSDGLSRLYSVAQGGAIREHSWTGTEWTDTVIDAISGATVDIAVGPGRNDDTSRVYVPSIQGWLFEFTHDSPFQGCAELPLAKVAMMSMDILPNPSRGEVRIRYGLRRLRDVELSLYDVSGREILRRSSRERGPGTFVETIESEVLEPGVYVCRLKAGDWSEVRTLVRLD
jgi:hypothetical protein